MSLHYYNRLEKGDLDAAIALKENTFEALSPFFQYTETAIRSLRRKEEIRVNWNIVATEKIQLKLLSCVYKIEHKTQIKILQETNWYLAHNFPTDTDFSEEIIIKEIKKKLPIEQSDIRVEGNSTYIHVAGLEFPLNKKKLKVDWGFNEFEITTNSVSIDNIQSIKYNYRDIDFQIENGKILLNGKIDPKNTILINDQPILFEIVSDAANDGLSKEYKVLKESLYESIVLSDKSINGLTVISIHDLVKELEIDPTNLTLEGNKNKFSFTHFDDKEAFLFTVDRPADYHEKILVSPNGIRFQCAVVTPNSKDKFLIQLVEQEDSKDDPYSKSSIDYFFDEDVSVKDDRGIEYDIGHRNSDEKQISLKQKGKNVLPNASSKYLSVKVSTYQLFKQQEAIRNIQNKPVREQRNLIKLFEPRSQVSWNHTLVNSNIQCWHVLKEDDRAGCLEQREFIHKALNTPDFAILEGPPGSGKTTVILELICQLIEKKHRILLCGSTHVAIDNVLERLKAKGLMDSLSIAPIRIGRETVISEEIKEYSLEKQKEIHTISERLLLESSNLVCGTTFGILQYPEFKEQRDEATPIVPNFDYLIIDECSKTTFQEFLVPAFYAKKWILVGDIQQLSPFTDREQIVSNLRELDLGKDNRTNQRKMLSKNLQEACYKLYLILQFSNNKKSYHERKFNRLAFAMDISAISEIRKEIQERMRKDNNPLKNIKFCYYESKSTLEELCDADIIFIDSKNIDSALKIIPEYFILLGYPEWLETSHYFKHRRIHQKGIYPFEVFHKGKSTNSVEKIYELLEEQMKEKDWAEELTWRLIRDFELRSKKKHFSFRQDLDELYPATEPNVRGRINTLRNIALPSILEGIQRGIKGKYNQEKTTLTEGFTSSELKTRHVKLKYQNRMHSEIANYPKAAFYNNDALLTDPTIDTNRIWDYRSYAHKSIWLNINGKTFGNKNIEEASIVLREIERFINWAKSHTHPDSLDNDGIWKIACLTFYKGQEKILREKLQNFCNLPNKHSQFMKDNVKIFLYTVDKFQGQEADIVFLSMVQTKRDGFLDNPNRLNVSITRARFQLVIVGNHDYFSNKSYSEELKNLAKNTNKVDVK